MMGGAGHMQDMVNKIKQNNALRASRRKNRKRKNSDIGSYNAQQLSFKKVSPQELEKINKRNLLLIKKENLRINIITLLIGVPIVIVMVYYIIRILTKSMS